MHMSGESLMNMIIINFNVHLIQPIEDVKIKNEILSL